jgi:hypothetical protein
MPDNPFESEFADTPAAVSLRGVRTADDLIRSAGGDELLSLLSSLGFWVGGGGNPTEPARTFQQSVADMAPDTLGNESSYWQSELSRVVAVVGALAAQSKLSKLDLSRAKSAAVVAVYDAASQNQGSGDDASAPPARAKALTKAQVDAMVAQRPEVQARENNLVIIEAAVVALDAAREAIEGYLRMLSREITRRGDLIRGRFGA